MNWSGNVTSLPFGTLSMQTVDEISEEDESLDIDNNTHQPRWEVFGVELLDHGVEIATSILLDSDEVWKGEVYVGKTDRSKTTTGLTFIDWLRTELVDFDNRWRKCNKSIRKRMP